VTFQLSPGDYALSDEFDGSDTAFDVTEPLQCVVRDGKGKKVEQNKCLGAVR
jgi:hypothetical protein